MYSYIYDERCRDGSLHRVLSGVEERVMDLGISGHICRLSGIKSLNDVIRQELNRGATTIVAVGDDTTVERVFNVLAGISHSPVLGIIPLFGKYEIASHLNIPPGLAACTILSYRMVQTLRLGKINNRYFLSTIVVDHQGVTLECDEQFRVRSRLPNPAMSIRITNSVDSPAPSLLPVGLKVEVTTTPRWPSWTRKGVATSVFLNSCVTLSCNDRFPMSIDDHMVIATPPVSVETTNKKIRVITGHVRASLRSPRAH